MEIEWLSDDYLQDYSLTGLWLLFDKGIAVTKWPSPGHLRTYAAGQAFPGQRDHFLTVLEPSGFTVHGRMPRTKYATCDMPTESIPGTEMAPSCESRGETACLSINTVHLSVLWRVQYST